MLAIHWKWTTSNGFCVAHKKCYVDKRIYSECASRWFLDFGAHKFDRLRHEHIHQMAKRETGHKFNEMDILFREIVSKNFKNLSKIFQNFNNFQKFNNFFFKIQIKFF